MALAPRPRTLAWAQATGGALTPDQRRMLRRDVARGYAGFLAGLARWPAVRRTASAAPQPREPDSRLAREAVEAAVAQGPALLGHGYRTWRFGAALARVDGVAVDVELLFVVSLLHDVGLLEAVAGEDFTLRSAVALGEVAARAVPEDGALPTRLGDAVVAHTTPGLTAQDDVLGHYVQAGAMADLVALRRWDLPRGCVDLARSLHPHHGVHGEIARLVAREARAVPEGRFALLHRAGFAVLVRGSLNRVR